MNNEQIPQAAYVMIQKQAELVIKSGSDTDKLVQKIAFRAGGNFGYSLAADQLRKKDEELQQSLLLYNNMAATIQKRDEEISLLKSGLSVCRNVLKEIDGYLSEKQFENGETVYRNNIGAFSTLHKNAIEALAPLPLKKEDIEDKKSTWSSGWDSAITVANNICVQISDHYNIIDDAARSDGADSCAKQIRKRLGDKSYYPERFPPDLTINIDQNKNKFTPEEIQAALNCRDKIISGDMPEELKAVYMAGEICMWNELKSK